MSGQTGHRVSQGSPAARRVVRFTGSGSTTANWPVALQNRPRTPKLIAFANRKARGTWPDRQTGVWIQIDRRRHPGQTPMNKSCYRLFSDVLVAAASRCRVRPVAADRSVDTNDKFAVRGGGEYSPKIALISLCRQLLRVQRQRPRPVAADRSVDTKDKFAVRGSGEYSPTIALTSLYRQLLRVQRQRPRPVAADRSVDTIDKFAVRGMRTAWHRRRIWWARQGEPAGRSTASAWRTPEAFAEGRNSPVACLLVGTNEGK